MEDIHDGEWIRAIPILSYIFYFQIGDAAKLVQYIGFILNFRRNAYRENGLASGNFKVSN